MALHQATVWRWLQWLLPTPDAVEEGTPRIQRHVAVGRARRFFESGSGLEALTAASPEMSPEELRTLLQVVAAIPDEMVRAAGLRRMAPHLEPALLDIVVPVVRSIADRSERVPERDLPGARKLGALGLSAPDLLSSARQRYRRRRNGALVEYRARNGRIGWRPGVGGVSRSRGDGIRRFTAGVLSDNVAMRKILDRFGAHWEREDLGVVTTVIDVPSLRDMSMSKDLYREIHGVARQVMGAVG